MKYTQLLIIGIVAVGFMAMFTLQSSDKVINDKPTIDTTSTIVMVEDDYNYDSLNNILDWYEAMFHRFHQILDKMCPICRRRERNR